MNRLLTNSIRIGIPILRLLSWYQAFWIIPFTEVLWAAPLQKQLVVPLAKLAWALLALVPFILLRFRRVFAVYAVGSSAVLMVLAWDYFVPFRYVAPGFSGTIPGDNFYSYISGSVAVWVSRPSFNVDDIPLFLVLISPLFLACVYRAFYPHWTKKAEQISGSNGGQGR
jgi:hypothetical protein